MTAQKPRRTRRRSVPASALPRPSTVEAEAAAAAEADEDAPSGRQPVTLRHRQHHVTKDYSYIHRDLLTIVGVGVIVIAFIVAMSFVVA